MRAIRAREKGSVSAATPAAAWPSLLLLTLAFWLRVHNLATQSFWYDEVATWLRANSNLQLMYASLLEARNQVPLYYLLMRPWALIGASEFVLRFASVLWGVLSVALIYAFGRRYLGRLAGLTAAFLLALSAVHVWYSQEARMYALLVLCALAAGWFLLRWIESRQRRHWLGYTAAMAVAVLVHYFGLLLLLAHYIFMAWHFRRQQLALGRWLLSVGIVVALLALYVAPGLAAGAGKLPAPAWVRPVNWRDPWLTLLSLSAGRTINPESALPYLAPGLFLAFMGAALLARPPLSAEGKLQAKAKQLAPRLLLIWLVVPWLLALTISLPWPIPGRPALSVYADRYLILVLPALLLLVAKGAQAVLRTRPLRPAAGLALALIAALNLAAIVNLYLADEHGREDWRSALAYVQQNGAEDSALIGRPDHRLPATFYAPSVPFIGLPPAPVEAELQDEFEAEVAARLAQAAEDHSRLWLINHAYNNDIHGFGVGREAQLAASLATDPALAWMNARYQAAERRTYPGIVLTAYDVSGRVADQVGVLPEAAK
ncbi:MAG: glycosyltransferase family 39 protein [Candidatus Promineifilaceae bacterium]